MKKIAVLVAIAAVAALAAPAFSAMTNPFMDVPMNHWAYDAIGQLAVHHIIDGYPDGLYRGKQPATRYELASVVARALAIVDMTKASKQDVEMLKRLVVEFKDELEALGVRVDELDERVAVLENRLGGWHIHGTAVVDARYRKAESSYTGKPDGTITFDEARLWFERTFGENDEYFFAARIRDEGGQKGAASDIRFDRFYVSMPFFMDTKFTLGRFNYNMGKAYIPDVANTGGWYGDPVLTNLTVTGFALEKNFGMGNFLVYVAHDDKTPNAERKAGQFRNAAEGLTPFSTINKYSWQIFAMGQFQFTENVGFDLGGQAFIGDNSSTTPEERTGNNINVNSRNKVLNWEGDENFKNLWTVFAGLRFNFNENIAIKGSFYHQKINAERVGYNEDRTSFGWRDYGYGWRDTGGSIVDSANHWRAIIDVKQEALKFTSLWLEYGQYKEGFWAPQGMSSIFFSESTVLEPFVGYGSQAMADINYWRVVLGQKWNEKWATHIFYYGYKVSDAIAKYNATTGAFLGYEDAKPYELGVGVQYKLNDATTMGLNYVHVDSDLPAWDNETETKDDIVRFRTAVSF